MKRSLIVIVAFLSFFLMCGGVKGLTFDIQPSSDKSFICASENVFQKVYNKYSGYFNDPYLPECLKSGECDWDFIKETLAAQVSVLELNTFLNWHCADLKMTSGTTEATDKYQVNDARNLSNYKFQGINDIQKYNYCEYCQNNPSDVVCQNDEQKRKCNPKSYYINDKTCGDISAQDNNQCYLETVYANDDAPSYYYVSLGPKPNNRYVDKGIYAYVFDMGYINTYSTCGIKWNGMNLSGANCYDSIEDTDKTRELNDVKQIISNNSGIPTNDFEIVDVAHLGIYEGNYAYYFHDKKNQIPDEMTPENTIHNFDYWAKNPYKAFLPMNDAYMEGDTLKKEYMDTKEWINQGYGLNVKSVLSFAREVYGSSMLFGANSWARKVYTPFVYKIKKTNMSCIYDSGEDKFYGKNGNEIFASNRDDKLEMFASDCGCDVVNNYWWITGIGNTDYYLKNCEHIAKTKTCSPTVKDTTCGPNGNENTFVIGDDITNDSCVFTSNNINTDVSDTSATPYKYTQNYNEYCSLTCAEKIDVTLPSEIKKVVAGQYWTWDTSDVKLTGTRVCNADISIDRYKNEIGISSSGNYSTDKTHIKQRLTGSGTNEGLYNKDNIELYPLLVELDDLKTAYNEYKDANNKLANGDYVDSYGCGTEDNPRTCYKCREKIFTSDYTGEEFIKYVDADGTCSKSSILTKTNDNNVTISTAMTNIKEKYEKIEKQIEYHTKNVNVCSESGNDGEDKSRTGLNDLNKIDYKFSPIVKLSYEDTTYGTSKYTFKSTISSESTDDDSSITNYDITKTPYNYTDIDGNPKTISYIDRSVNRLSWKKTAVYDSQKYYYSTLADFSLGKLSYKTTLEDYNSLYNNNYKFGNNFYPVSLNVPSGKYKFYFEISNIGVDPTTGTTTNRFGKLVNPTISTHGKDRDSVEYMCYYNVETDVTTPTKPNFFYRNISLNNFDPNNREAADTLGKNWSNEKGQTTRCAIEGGEYVNGECNIPQDAEPESIYEEPEYSFTLTPENMQNIKTHNRELEKQGIGYTDFDMNPATTQMVNGGDGIQNIWYTSNFLDSDEYFKSKTINGRKFEAWQDVQTDKNMGPAWK